MGEFGRRRRSFAWSRSKRTTFYGITKKPAGMMMDSRNQESLSGGLLEKALRPALESRLPPLFDLVELGTASNSSRLGAVSSLMTWLKISAVLVLTRGVSVQKCLDRLIDSSEPNFCVKVVKNPEIWQDLWYFNEGGDQVKEFMSLVCGVYIALLQVAELTGRLALGVPLIELDGFTTILNPKIPIYIRRMIGISQATRSLLHMSFTNLLSKIGSIQPDILDNIQPFLEDDKPNQIYLSRKIPTEADFSLLKHYYTILIHLTIAATIEKECLIQQPEVCVPQYPAEILEKSARQLEEIVRSWNPFFKLVVENVVFASQEPRHCKTHRSFGLDFTAKSVWLASRK